MGYIIESRQLRSAYKACGRGEEDSLCGFKHSFINQLGGNFHKFDLSFPIWQYDFKEMTKPVELGALTYTDPSAPLSCRTCVQEPFYTAGICDALLVWIEYALPADKNLSANFYSTNNCSHRQLVRMLKDPVDVAAHEIGQVMVMFVCKSVFGGINGAVDHTFEIQILLSSGLV